MPMAPPTKAIVDSLGKLGYFIRSRGALDPFFLVLLTREVCYTASYSKFLREGKFPNIEFGMDNGTNNGFFIQEANTQISPEESERLKMKLIAAYETCTEYISSKGIADVGAMTFLLQELKKLEGLAAFN